MPRSKHPKKRVRPTAYRKESGLKSRPIVLSSGRGDTAITVREAVELVADLLATIAQVEPGLAFGGPELTLALANRVADQSEILSATAMRRREGRLEITYHYPRK